MSKRFKNLSDQDKTYIRTVHVNDDLSWDTRMSMLRTKFDVSERTIRRWIAKLGISDHKEVENEEIRQGRLREYDYSKKRFIITWAQNATPVHSIFWGNILKYADEIGANVGVIQGRYQNPTSLWSNKMQDDEWWDESFTVYEKDADGYVIWLDETGKEVPPQEVADYVAKKLNGELFNDRRVRPKVKFSYLDAGRHQLHEYLDLLSDVKVRPTAKKPLTGFESISGERSSILGHPRVHLKSLPVLKGHPNKLLLTTGACTIKNYTDTKAGKVAEFHHTYGFVVVEIKDDLIFYIRQITADDSGDFTDLNYHVSGGEVSKIDECDAFIMGDLHSMHVHEPTLKRTMEMFDVIRPRNVVLHDIFDGSSVNHHEAKNPLKAFRRYNDCEDLVYAEIINMLTLLEEYKLTDYNPIVVRSNHDLWLDRWIAEKDWRTDVRNAVAYMQYATAVLEGKAPKGLIPYILDKNFGDSIITLDLDDSYKINGWEVGQHGHLGTHGSKGNLVQFEKLNTKIIVGDYHQPGRLDGAVGVGTYSKLRMGYNNGPSAWMNAGAIIHKDGKVQHIIFQEDDRFTTFDDFNQS